MRFGFVTCVQLGLSCMEAIYEIGGTLELALTLSDDHAQAKSGRIYIDAFCSQNSIRLHKIAHINHPITHRIIQETNLDWLFIIGWSQIASPSILTLPRLGALGMHPTLLPEGRGRAAIPWAILKGLKETGVSLFKLDVGLDTGPILSQIHIPLDPTTTATELYAKVNSAHALLMREAFPMLRDGVVTFAPQDESRATVWPGRTPADGEIDLNGSVWEAERLVRATTHPYPGAFVWYHGQRRSIWKARVHRFPPAADGLVPEENILAFRDGWLEILPG